jgi:hypothetical protein
MTSPHSDAIAHLTYVAVRYRDAKVKLEQQRSSVALAIRTALEAGVPPTEVAAVAPYTPAYVRRGCAQPGRAAGAGLRPRSTRDDLDHCGRPPTEAYGGGVSHVDLRVARRRR